MVSKTMVGDHTHAQCQFKRAAPRSAAVTFSAPLTLSLSLSLPRHFPVPVPLQTHLLSPPTELTFPRFPVLGKVKQILNIRIELASKQQHQSFCHQLVAWVMLLPILMVENCLGWCLRPSKRDALPKSVLPHYPPT